MNQQKTILKNLGCGFILYDPCIDELPGSIQAILLFQNCKPRGYACIFSTAHSVENPLKFILGIN
jgi:hypothetical protein